MKISTSILLFVLLFSINTEAQSKIHKVNIGDLKLESGKVISDCEIAYSAYGKPNADSSNIIVLFTWFAGKSDAYSFMMGKDGWIDTLNFHYIVVDALGDGMSSSPSNVKENKGKDFPDITIRDMVNSEYILLNKKLRIKHVYSIGGLSMGAFQTFQWVVSYPDFMDKAIVLAGTPAVSTYDLLFYNSAIDILETGIKNKINIKDAYSEAISVFTMNFMTPDYLHATYKAEDFNKFKKEMIDSYIGIDYFDWLIQLKALCTQNIYLKNNNDIAKTCDGIKAKMIIINNNNDLIVNPITSKEFSKQKGAQLIELTSNCGHLSSMCEMQKISDAIKRFLTK